MPRSVCNAATTGGQRPFRQHRRDLRRQPIAPRRGGLDRLNVILENEVVSGPLKTQSGQPPAARLGPGEGARNGALAQQKPAERLACPAQAVHRVEPRPHQIAHRPVAAIGNPHRRQLAGAMQPRQARRIPPIGLDPVVDALGDQRGGDHDTFVPAGRQATVNDVTARPAS
jgi:hypothetical protein